MLLLRESVSLASDFGNVSKRCRVCRQWCWRRDVNGKRPRFPYKTWLRLGSNFCMESLTPKPLQLCFFSSQANLKICESYWLRICGLHKIVMRDWQRLHGYCVFSKMLNDINNAAVNTINLKPHCCANKWQILNVKHKHLKSRIPQLNNEILHPNLCTIQTHSDHLRKCKPG